MDDAAKFRANAEDCRRQAEQAALKENRETLLELARQWETLADSWEKRRKKKR